MDHIQVATAVALIVGYFASHAAGLLTRAHAPDWVLGGVTVVLTALAGVLPTVAWNAGDSWSRYLTNVFAALVAAFLGHKSKVPSALKAGTPGVVGKRRA